MLLASPFFKGGLRGFNNLSIINKLKSLKPTPSVPLLKKGEVKGSFASTSITNKLNYYEKTICCKIFN